MDNPIPPRAQKKKKKKKLRGPVAVAMKTIMSRR
jgi:hypothetical protein